MKSKLFLLFPMGVLFFDPLTANDWFAYTADNSNDQVITFDIQTKLPGNTIPDGVSEEVAITPNAQTLYVINQNDTVSVIDLASQSLTQTIPLNAGGVNQQPSSIAITLDGTTAYITATDSLGGHNLLKLDLATQAYTIIPLVPNIEADALAITPDGSMIYLTQTDAVVGMTIPGNNFGTPIPVPGRSSRIAIAPSGLFAYVSDEINSNVYEIDLTLPAFSRTIALTANSQPNNIAVSADGQWIYTANENANFATSINIPASYAVSNISLGILPTNYTQQGVAISPDSKTVVLSNLYATKLSTIEVGSSVVTNTSVIGNPGFLAITPDQAPVASFTSAIAPPLMPTSFVSTSTTDVGTIASYFWDFGDGNTLQTTLNPVQHTYLTGGTYHVTLTVTNSGGTSTSQTFTGQTVSNNGGPSATTTSLIAIPFLVPVVTGVNPPSGFPGISVNIVGSNFTGATSVQFGGISASFIVQSDTLITAVVPAGNQGTVPVTVTNPAGTSAITPNSQFTDLTSIFPPTSVRGFQIHNKFLLQTDVVNILEWNAPTTGDTPVAYSIYNEAGQLLATVPSSSGLTYQIHNQMKKRTYTYTIVSIGQSGETSLPVSVTVASR